MKNKTTIIWIFLLCAFGQQAIAQQEVVMSIKEGMPIIPVAVPDFVIRETAPSLKKAADTLRDVITADLKYSRVFTTLPSSYYGYIRPLNPERIFFKDWESIQAKLLFVGEVATAGGEDFLVEAKIYDVKSERFIVGKRYQAEKGLLRLVAHKISNEFMKIYGEPEIFTTKIIFVSNRDENDELYMMDYDGYNQTRLTFNKYKDYMPSWSMDGSKIAYTVYRGGLTGLYMLDVFAGKRSEIYTKGTSYGASFSPNGKKMVFCSTGDESNAELYIAESDGSRCKRLTFNKAIDTAPSWSPTNREIAFTSDRGGTPQIYIMDAEGSNVRRMSFGGNYHDAPAWAPTGDRIAYVSRVYSIFDIYILNLQSQQIVKLTESNARNESPCWSPDGRHLIFSSNRSGSIQLYTIDYDGSHLRRLTSQGTNKLPDWSRN